MLLSADEIDRRLTWPSGRAAELAEARRLPHLILPDGTIRFEWKDVEALLTWVEPGEVQP